MRLYADLFVVVNVTVNGLLLWATAVLTGTRPVPWRMAAAALLGAAYATAALWLPPLRSPAGVALAAGAMLAGAFWPVAARTALLQAGVLVALSAV
ncbi:MAG TPA: sigma-E processing peptidase SpoIIGA, partial [Bacillota bacterium]